jgi:hypothetical protein
MSTTRRRNLRCISASFLTAVVVFVMSSERNGTATAAAAAAACCSGSNLSSLKVPKSRAACARDTERTDHCKSRWRVVNEMATG